MAKTKKKASTKKTTAKKAAKKSTKKNIKKSAKKTTKKASKKASKMTPKATTKKATKKAASKAKTASAKPAAKKVSKSSTVYAGVPVGGRVPSFHVAATSGRTVTEQDLTGKITVLYFYPKDNTPGCTLEGHDFRTRHDDFKAQGAQIFGISRDSIKSHEGFKSKCGFPFELLSDDADQIAKIFDVIQMKSLYGRSFEGIERSTFVIDQNGVLRREWRKVKVDGHAAEILEYIKGGMKE